MNHLKNESFKSAKIGNTSTNINHGRVDSLEAKIKFLETENKLLKDDKNKQKPIDSILEHNSILIQAQNVLAQNH